MKYLLLLLVLAIAYGIWRGQRRAPPPAARPSPRPQLPQNMVACAHCGLHLPRTEALAQDGHYYCCAEHRPSAPR